MLTFKFNGVCLIVLLISITNEIDARSIISGDSTINCDGSSSCINSIMYCPLNADCYIDCNYGLISSSYCDPKGCCSSTIYCPNQKYCQVDCGGGCDNVTIYAQNATSLYVKNCDTTNSMNRCRKMNIYCPINQHNEISNNCQFEGTANIESSNIFTQHGFADMEINTSLTITNTMIHCGKTATENSCLSNSNGTACKSGTICNNFTLFSNQPTISTSNPTMEPTMEPTDGPTMDTIINQIPSTNDTNPRNNPQKLETQPGSFYDLKVVLIACCLVLLCCFIVLLIAFWCRKEYLDTKEQLNKPLLMQMNNHDDIVCDTNLHKETNEFVKFGFNDHEPGSMQKHIKKKTEGEESDKQKSPQTPHIEGKKKNMSVIKLNDGGTKYGDEFEENLRSKSMGIGLLMDDIINDMDETPN